MRITSLVGLLSIVIGCVDHDILQCYNGTILGYDCCVGTTLISVEGPSIGIEYNDGVKLHGNVIQVPGEITGDTINFTVHPNKDGAAGTCYCLRSIFRYDIPMYDIIQCKEK